MSNQLYDIWAVSRYNIGHRFRVEFRLSTYDSINILPRLRRIYPPEHYSLIRKPTQTQEQERLEAEYDELKRKNK